jgi:hypothetical protein
MVIDRRGDRQIIVSEAFVDCSQGSSVDFECVLKALVWYKGFLVILEKQTREWRHSFCDNLAIDEKATH